MANRLEEIEARCFGQQGGDIFSHVGAKLVSSCSKEKRGHRKRKFCDTESVLDMDMSALLRATRNARDELGELS